MILRALLGSDAANSREGAGAFYAGDIGALRARHVRCATFARQKEKPMTYFRALPFAMCGVLSLAGCGSDDDSSDPVVETSTTVLDLGDVKANPGDYEWFDFRPNVKKLILAGAAETEHIAILWYTVTDGAVGLHYHSKTESVYVIDGTQTDAEGVYPTGSVYFNPPGSGHEISDSSGFFLLAYASPPDFTSTDLIEEYTPVVIETDDPELTSTYEFEEANPGVGTYAPSLDGEGGLSAEFIETTSSDAYDYVGNYLLVLKGTCEIEAEIYGEDTLIVTKAVEPQPYKIAAAKADPCLAMGVSF
jgi:hypothetical protein